MSEFISISIPRDVTIIRNVVDYLENEAERLEEAVAEVIETGPVTTAAPAPGPAAVVDKDNTVVELKPAAPAGNVVVVAAGDKATGAAGIVEVDEGDRIPWDARIHGAGKSTLKRGGTWKLARGVDPALVTTVIAELKATMAAPGKIDYEAEAGEIDQQAAAELTAAAPAPAAIAPPPAPPATHVVDEPDNIYIVEGSGEFTADALLKSGWTDEQIATLPIKPVESVTGVTTFPELMSRITAAGLDEATILAAVTKQGIMALPLLAARPDLIPAVDAELFPA